MVLRLLRALLGGSRSGDRSAAMRELRTRMLVTPPAELGIKAGEQCPRVFGVLMDWPLGDATVTLVALCDGNASLYTTSSFGVIGGIGHSRVREAAGVLTREADRHHEEAKPTSDHSYP